MTLTNRRLGNSFESEFCEILAEHGYWVHNLAQNASGQPADVIAVRNGKTYLIDCKVCSTRGFALSRIEENQDLAMELWKSCGNGEGWFAVQVYGHQIVMIPRIGMDALRREKSVASVGDLIEFGVSLERWLKKT